MGPVEDDNDNLPQRELTYGEYQVGYNFNPSGDQRVQKIKQLYAEVIDLLDAERKKVDNPSEVGAMLTLSIREAQTAQMWAVKSVTFGK